MVLQDLGKLAGGILEEFVDGARGKLREGFIGGAITVDGPEPLRMSTSPAAVSAAASVVEAPAAGADSRFWAFPLEEAARSPTCTRSRFLPSVTASRERGEAMRLLAEVQAYANAQPDTPWLSRELGYAGRQSRSGIKRAAFWKSRSVVSKARSFAIAS